MGKTIAPIPLRIARKVLILYTFGVQVIIVGIRVWELGFRESGVGFGPGGFQILGRGFRA